MIRALHHRTARRHSGAAYVLAAARLQTALGRTASDQSTTPVADSCLATSRIGIRRQVVAEGSASAMFGGTCSAAAGSPAAANCSSPNQVSRVFQCLDVQPAVAEGGAHSSQTRSCHSGCAARSGHRRRGRRGDVVGAIIKKIMWLTMSSSVKLLPRHPRSGTAP